MKNLGDFSEKYSKYLVRIKYFDAYYFTVTGADLEDNETEKVIVDAGNHILLFCNIADLLNVAKSENCFFDRKNMNKWASVATQLIEPYANIDFDSLIGAGNGFENLNEAQSAFYSLGFLTDFAIQVNDLHLLRLLNGRVITRFKDEMMDVLIWKINRRVKVKGLIGDDSLIKEIKDVYDLIGDRVKVVTTNKIF